MSSAQSYAQKRKSRKTYSRNGNIALDEKSEPAMKRRRVMRYKYDEGEKEKAAEEGRERILSQCTSSSTMPSSPPKQSRATFSSDPPDEAYESLPSSPPSRLPSPPKNMRKSAFSFLRRKQGTSCGSSRSPIRIPLAELDNARACEILPLKRKQRLTQTQIDLGGDIRKTCRTCGMDFIPTNIEDQALHRKFHAMNVGGIDLGTGFGKAAKLSKVWEPSTVKDVRLQVGYEFVMVVDRGSSLADKNKVKRALDVVNTELSAVGIDDERLWGQLPKADLTKLAFGAVGTESSQVLVEDIKDRQRDRFKAFLYIKRDKCVGLCLAERISKAYRVLKEKALPQGEDAGFVVSKSSSVSVSKEADCAILGVSRIWTSTLHRRQGVALKLLECAAMNTVYGMVVPKEMIAFSQPTESGGRLAEKWFGGQHVWHVYAET
ncbi:MAG: N-acetyltransferase O1 (Establishment of cohesion protein 1) [Pycnora praestabilis]|nr:MAG: N-acetyltransferase O1 (Establishment of cohesion protein 1) [Pycnora praestabilis]